MNMRDKAQKISEAAERADALSRAQVGDPHNHEWIGVLLDINGHRFAVQLDGALVDEMLRRAVTRNREEIRALGLDLVEEA